MSHERILCGFIPLVDAATLVVAREMGFAAEEGIELALARETSWSNIRDKLALGLIDAAHMLAPMPIAMSIGLSAMPRRVIAPFMLSVNGNTFGVSPGLAKRIRAAAGRSFFADDARAAGQALKAATDGRRLRVGAPWPYSMHVALVEYWLSRVGFDLDRDVAITIVPPPFMADAMSSGEIDAYCVGEPWGSVAAEQGVGEVMLPTSAIWAFAPEKVLGVAADTAEERGDALSALIRALYRAAKWTEQPEHVGAVAQLLAETRYLDAPSDPIERALRRRLLPAPDADETEIPNLLALHRGAATFPWRSQAQWIADELARRHKLAPEAVATAREAFRPDLYRRALEPMGVDLPAASEKVEGSFDAPEEALSTRGMIQLGPDRFFDGGRFDPSGAKPGDAAGPAPNP